MENVNLWMILLAGLMASGSPGPATLTIAGTSMQLGRGHGLAVAAGITTGSFIWSVAAAFGLSAVMLAHLWMFKVIRYLGAAYLLWLAFKSARSALSPASLSMARVKPLTYRQAYSKGVFLHLTNPKPILFFGALYAIGVTPGAPVSVLVTVILAVGLQSLIVFHSYALIFASAPMTRAYIAARRGFETVFAIGFAAAGLKILTARLS